MFEVTEHTADLGLRVRAPDLNTLFAEAGRGFSSLVVEDFQQSIAPAVARSIEIEADSTDLLLFDWLSELLFLADVEQLVFVDFEVRATPLRLHAQCRGEPFEPARHDLHYEVKAVTYHALRVEQREDGWLAEVVLDI